MFLTNGNSGSLYFLKSRIQYRSIVLIKTKTTHAYECMYAHTQNTPKCRLKYVEIALVK